MNSTFDLENPAIKNGVMAGLAASAITLVFYLVNARWVFTTASWVTTPLFIVMMVRSVKADKILQQYTSFSDALKPGFLTYVVATLIYTCFFFVLLNFIAPELITMQKEIALEALEKMAGLLGEDAMETAVDQMQARDFSFTLSTAAWSFAWGLIFPGFIIAAIIALVMKDRKPNFE